MDEQRMHVHETLQRIRHELLEVSGKGARKKLLGAAKAFDDLLSQHEQVPDGCFALWLEIFSQQALYNKPGMHIFFLNLQVCMHALSPAQKHQALTTIRSAYSGYTELQTCWFVGDLVARCYGKDEAFAFFKALFAISTPQGREGLALGLDVLRRQHKDERSLRLIEQILRSA